MVFTNYSLLLGDIEDIWGGGEGLSFYCNSFRKGECYEFSLSVYKYLFLGCVRLMTDGEKEMKSK